MERIKFSICIPNYNYANFIGKTIQSVLNQEYRNFEIIISDNCSTDRSLEVIRSFKDPRIHLRENNINIGFSPNLDKACQDISGDYIILLSSDDLMKPNALSVFARLIAESNGLEDPLVLISSIDIINEKDEIMGFRYALIDQIVKGLKNDKLFNDQKVGLYFGHQLLKYALCDNFTIVGRFLSTCYSRELFKKVEGYRSIMNIMPDAHFSHKIMLLNPKTVVVKESLFSYRIHGKNNYASIFNHIKLAYDAYLMTTLYTDSLLSQIGLKNSILKKNYVKYWGQKVVCSSAIENKIKYAIKIWHLMWACYPEIYCKSIVGWVFPLFLPFLFLLGVFMRLRTFLKRVIGPKS
jgi:glycosyltransferase involved in cell wall biosynthesis